MADSKPAVLQAAGSVLAAEVASRVRPNVKLIGLLALGHLVIDVNQGALSALLPSPEKPFVSEAHKLLVELTLTAGTFGYFVLLYAIFTRLFPIIAVWEYKEGFSVRAEHEDLPRLTEPVVASGD